MTLRLPLFLLALASTPALSAERHLPVRVVGLTSEGREETFEMRDRHYVARSAGGFMTIFSRGKLGRTALKSYERVFMTNAHGERVQLLPAGAVSTDQLREAAKSVGTLPDPTQRVLYVGHSF